MTNDLFEGTSNDQNDAPSNDDISVDQLVGDDKQYKTVDDLAKAKRHADGFIDQLKSELSGLRSELNTLRDDNTTRERLEAVLDQLNSRTQSQEDDELDDSYQESPSRSSQPDTQNIDALIESKLTKIERERTANQNRLEAVNKLKELYGDDYRSRLEQQTAALGLTKEEMNNLAGRSPNAFLALVAPQGSTTDDRPVTAPRSSVNSGNYTTSSPQPGTPEFYAKLKRDDPKRYWTPKVQNQLHKDAIRAAQEGRDFKLA